MTLAATTPRPAGPRAITRTFDLMKTLAGRADGLSLTELSAALSVPKSTLIDTLRGLCALGYLAQREGRYRLGSASYHFAGVIAAGWSAPEMIRAQVRTLADETGESVGFAIADWESGQAFYTEAVNSRQPVHYAMRAGLRAPLYASAAGRVLLAHAATDEVDAYLSRAHLKRLTERTCTGASAIRASLKTIRRQGYCASFGEMLSDTAAIAVPLHGPAGDHLGALMIAAPLDRLKLNFERLRDAVLRAGRDASAGAMRGN